jgi:hypothetical protein
MIVAQAQAHSSVAFAILEPQHQPSRLGHNLDVNVAPLPDASLPFENADLLLVSGRQSTLSPIEK